LTNSYNGPKRKVILVTDGDNVARKTVEAAVRKLGARVISRSAGNPTPLTGGEIVALVHQALHDPVVVMFDDNGFGEEGAGEKALREVVNDPTIEVLGAVAVASNTKHVLGTNVSFSIDSLGNVVVDGVDKEGVPQGQHSPLIMGDTVDVLNECTLPIIVGMGDIGKMNGHDAHHKGAPVTTAAIWEIMRHSGYETTESGLGTSESE
jgi:stage V sporulation protein AE